MGDCFLAELEYHGAAEQFETLLEGGNQTEAQAFINGLHPTDAAGIITELPPKLRAKALVLAHPEHAASIVEELDDDVRAGAIEEMDPEIAAAILGEMYTDEEADVLGDVDPEIAEAIMAKLDRQDAEDVRELLIYGEDTAGGLMQKEFITVPMHYTASETVVMLRQNATEFADFPVGYLYAVDEQNRLQGLVTIRSLLLCEGTAKVSEIMNPEPVTVTPEMPGEELVRVFERHKFLAVPVVDRDGKIRGTVLQDDALTFAIEESEEELLRASGILGGEELREMPIHSRVLNRFVWLGTKVLLNMIPIAVITAHESVISSLAAVAALMPIVSDMGGGAGSQAIAVSIRELSLERVKPRDYLEVLIKECSVGIVIGFLLAALLGIIFGVKQHDSNFGMLAAAAIGINTIVAVAVGGLLPLLLRRMKVDPAAASSPLLTTVTDTVGFWLVLTFAEKFLT